MMLFEIQPAKTVIGSATADKAGLQCYCLVKQQTMAYKKKDKSRDLHFFLFYLYLLYK